MNLRGPKFRDHYRSGGPWFPHLHCWGMADLVTGTYWSSMMCLQEVEII